jgi:hypothetical protein
MPILLLNTPAGAGFREQLKLPEGYNIWDISPVFLGKIPLLVGFPSIYLLKNNLY